MALAGPGVHADYAVLRSGVRLHFTGYEPAADRIRLTVEGGTVEVAREDIRACSKSQRRYFVYML